MNMKKILLIILFVSGLCFAGNFQRSADTVVVKHKTAEKPYRTSTYESPDKPFYNPYSSPTGTHGSPGYFMNPHPKPIPSREHHIGPLPPEHRHHHHMKVEYRHKKHHKKERRD